MLRQLAINSYRIILVITPIILGGLLAQPDADWRDVLQLFGNRISTDAAGATTTSVPAPVTAGGILSLLLALWVVVKPAIEAAREVVNFDLQEALKYAPFEEQISELMQLQNRFEEMVKVLVGDNGRLVVFIDDLDRCTPDKVPEVLEAIKLFTTTPRCVYFLGLDHDIVRQGIETKYKFKSSEASAEYLEKVVQIPFHLPPLGEDRIEVFVSDYYPDLQEQNRTVAEVFSKGLEPNPRKVKRALNIYRTLIDLADERVSVWEMDPVDPELVAKMVVIESRFRPLHEYLVRHPDFLLKLEEKALTDDGLSEEALKADGDLDVVLLGKPETEESSAKEGLLEASTLEPLNEMLKAGIRRFSDEDQRKQISSYIYLIATTEGVEGQTRPSRQEREALLGGNHAEIKKMIDEILMRGADEETRQEIARAYIERLELVVTDSERYTDVEQESANIALNLLDMPPAGATNDSVKAWLSAHLPQGTLEEMDAAPVGAAMMVSRSEARIHRRLLNVLDGSGFYNLDQVMTANIALDLLKGWKPQDYEPQTVIIPTGPFLMGSIEEQVKKLIETDMDKEAAMWEQPQHSVALKDYRIGRYPVTNAQYQFFVRQAAHEPPGDWQGDNYPEGKGNHPVVLVTWHDAVAYCQWLSQTTGRSYRLPSEAEWEKAARGGDGRIYPWGDEFDPALANTEAAGIGGTSPVDQYPAGASPYGVVDMIGNVWEWTLSLWGEDPSKPAFLYPYVAGDGREQMDAPDSVWRVLRGGSFARKSFYCRCAFRYRVYPYDWDYYHGFRVVASPFLL